MSICSFLNFFLIFFTCVTSQLCHVSKKNLNLVPIFVFSFNLLLIFVKIEQYCLSFNWDLIYFLYKSYENILTKINILIKYFWKYF